jgi:hypothetical protein
MIDLYDDIPDSYDDEEEIVNDWLDEIDNIPEGELRKIFKELETESFEEEDEDLLNDKFNI